MFRYPKDRVIIKQEAVLKKDQEYYTCDFCDGGPWPTEADVEIHRKHQHKYDLIKLLNDVTSNTCSVCLRPQADTHSLIEHIKSAHLFCPPNATKINRELFICDYCHGLFFNKQFLIVHINYWHPQTPEIRKRHYNNCPKCWKKVQGKSMWFHFLNHGLLSTSTCPICLFTLNNHSDMIEHIKSHSSYFCCNICGYETSKEMLFNRHNEKHRKNMRVNSKIDFARYFLPPDLQVTLKNRLYSFFRGIPLTNEVKICVLCRELCVTDEEMKQHIYGDHAPEEEAKSKTHRCMCGEQFFNSVLLKHHIFKLKGEHKVWDGVTPPPGREPEGIIPLSESDSDEMILEEESDHQIVYQVFEIPDPISMNVNDIIIAGLQAQIPSDSEEDYARAIESMEES